MTGISRRSDEDEASPHDWNVKDTAGFVAFALIVVSLGWACYLMWKSGFARGGLFGEQPSSTRASRDLQVKASWLLIGGPFLGALIARTKWSVVTAIVMGLIGAFLLAET